jgi:hypothetical protein
VERNVTFCKLDYHEMEESQRDQGERRSPPVQRGVGRHDGHQDFAPVGDGQATSFAPSSSPAAAPVLDYGGPMGSTD